MTAVRVSPSDPPGLFFIDEVNSRNRDHLQAQGVESRLNPSAAAEELARSRLKTAASYGQLHFEARPSGRTIQRDDAPTCRFDDRTRDRQTQAAVAHG
ncbi:MAG: hypothetical protein WCC31_12710, partial [Terracidiphilus sp.]